MKIKITYTDGKFDEIDCSAALVKKETNTLDVLYNNGDMEYFNWDKIRSFRLELIKKK